jgi:hypothetical protein
VSLNTFDATYGRRRAAGRAAASRTLLLPQPRRQLLAGVIATLDACIAKISAANLHETATLLSIARLDLLSHLNGITDLELQEIVANAQNAQGSERVV